MRRLEERYPDVVAVVGVHSGKYTTERETARIREAAIRLGVHHPIVNDRQFRVWRSYAVRAWPTLVAVSPTGHVIGSHAGEFTADALDPFVQGTLAAASQGSLDRSPPSITLDAPSIAPGRLRYPGKVALDGDRLAIADSGHHRVLVGRLAPDGTRLQVERTFGGAAGFVDGLDPRFDIPQGLAFDGGTLYVADSRNHALRAIDLASGFVRTVAGTGTQLRTRRDREAGTLSSPWDVAVVHEPSGATRLFVAMAGVHQIWTVTPTGEGLDVHCGSGAEELADGVNRQAALAQPMGIAAGDGRLWFVDAESSAVRWSELAPGGSVGTIVGTGLFDFGDRDGVGDAVRMQHQQAIARAPDGRLLVADSYNDALKWIDPATRSATTWARGFHEPSGIALGERFAYVADTNAHRIAVADLATASVGTLALDD